MLPENLLADAEVLLVTNPEGWSNTNALQEEPVTKTNPPDAKKQERMAFSEEHAACFPLGNTFPSCVQGTLYLSSLPRRPRAQLLLPYNTSGKKTKHLGPSLVSVDSTQGSTKTALERGFFSLSAARGAPRWKGTHLWLPKLAGHSPRRLTDNSFDLSLSFEDSFQTGSEERQNQGCRQDHRNPSPPHWNYALHTGYSFTAASQSQGQSCQ